MSSRTGGLRAIPSGTPQNPCKWAASSFDGAAVELPSWYQKFWSGPFRRRLEVARNNGFVASRSTGLGSLFVRQNRRGGETWYAKVRVNGRQVKRALGPKRPAGSREGLTKAQAEAALRRLVNELEAGPPPPVEERTLAQVGESYLRELGTRGRRRSTLGDYESYLRVHLVPFFDGTPLRKIGRAEVEAFMAAKLEAGLAPMDQRTDQVVSLDILQE
jgi:hypothetical protein